MINMLHGGYHMFHLIIIVFFSTIDTSSGSVATEGAVKNYDFKDCGRQMQVASAAVITGSQFGDDLWCNNSISFVAASEFPVSFSLRVDSREPLSLDLRQYGPSCTANQGGDRSLLSLNHSQHGSSYWQFQTGELCSYSLSLRLHERNHSGSISTNRTQMQVLITAHWLCDNNTTYRCSDLACIDRKLVCDGLHNCAQNDDEPSSCSHRQVATANANANAIVIAIAQETLIVTATTSSGEYDWSIWWFLLGVVIVVGLLSLMTFWQLCASTSQERRQSTSLVRVTSRQSHSYSHSQSQSLTRSRPNCDDDSETAICVGFADLPPAYENLEIESTSYRHCHSDVESDDPPPPSYDQVVKNSRLAHPT